MTPAAGSAGWDPDLEDLRIALVMNGGVSLAVWIGGLTLEINRLVRKDRAYAGLLDLLHTQVSVDIISGTSAGGINGAVLAASIVHGCAVDPLRDLWVERGSMQSLLRHPADSGPPSLLRGDDYLLRELESAFRGLSEGRRLLPPSEVPLTLFLTATLLKGEPVELADDFGTAIADVRHAGVFRFGRGPDAPRDDFAGGDVVRRLARAARSSSSFPMAFEASYVRVGRAEGSEDAPDMRDHVNFRSSRFVTDGGVLDNKPLGSAIDAIFEQRIDRDTRRVVAYVVPNPGETASAGADKPGEPPDAARIAAASLFTLPRVEPVAEEIQAIRKRNRELLEARESRIRLTAGMSARQAERTIRTLAGRLFPVYRSRRTAPAISYIVSQLADGMAGSDLRQDDAGAASAGSDGAGRLWLERQSHRSWLAAAFSSATLPWVPVTNPVTVRPRDALPDDLTVAGWRWGVRLVENGMLSVLDILRTTQRLAPLGAAIRQPERLPSMWHQAFDLLRALRALRRSEGAHWKERAASLRSIFSGEVSGSLLAERLERWTAEQLAAWATAPCDSYRVPDRKVPRIEAAGELGHAMAGLLVAIAPLSRTAIESARGSRLAEDRKAAADLATLLDSLVPMGAAVEDVVLRVATIDVAQYALGSSPRLTDQYVELIQVSANTPTAFGGPSRAEEKLAGIQLGHFGAFYKRSWRANDWMHGRLDGAANLVRAVMSPDRLRRLAALTEAESAAAAMCLRIEALVLPGEEDGDARELLLADWDREGVLRELSYLDEPDRPAPDALPLCTAAMIRRLQLDILRDELVATAEAQLADEAEWPPERGRLGPGALLLRAIQSRAPDVGIAAAPAGAVERERSRNAVRHPQRLAARDAVELFRRYRIGEERITGDVGSDLFSITLAHTLAVGAAMAAGPGDRLGKARHLVRVFRGITLVFYLLVRNVTSGSRTAAAANASAMAIGATIVLVSLLGLVQGLPALFVLAGWVLLIGAILSALVRRTLVTIVLLVVGVLAFATRGAWPPRPAWLEAVAPLGPLLAVALVTATLYLLGSARRPAWWIERQRKRRAARQSRRPRPTR